MSSSWCAVRRSMTGLTGKEDGNYNDSVLWLSWNRIVSGFAGWEVLGVVVDGVSGDV